MAATTRGVVMNKQKPAILNTYRVKGTFSYLEFCHTSESDREECPSFEECEGHEVIKTIDVTEDEYTEDGAAQSVILGYRDYYTNATWLIGYPTVKYLHSELNLSTFWTRKKSEQETIRNLIKGMA
jgi:hypothetical protein